MSDPLHPRQRLGAVLCDITRTEFRKYSVRTQAASFDSTPMAEFRRSIARKYGPGGDWDPDMAKRLSFHAHLYLSAAEQHLAGLQTLLTYDLSNLAIGPAARSVAEASGRVLWLLDFRLHINGSGARRRVARYLLDDEENARVHKRVSYAFSHPDRAKSGDAARAAKDRIRKPGIFWPSDIEINQTTGNLRLCNETLPGPSKFVRLAGEMFGDDPRETAGYYGYMSAMTHPTIFTFIETLADLDSMEKQSAYIPPRNDGEFALKLASNATRDFYNAWRAWISWTDTGLDEANLVHEAHQRANSDDDI